MLLHQHEIDFYFRVPGAGSQDSNVDYGHQASHRKFLDDTGSSMPIIFQDDVERINSYAGGSKPPFLCYIHSTNADRGTTVSPTCLIEYNIRSTLPNHDWMRPPNSWVSVQTVMKPHYFNPAIDYRLSGLWMRRILYTATAPDNLGLICLAEDFTTLIHSLPQADVRNAVPQPAYGPSDPESVNTAPTIYVRSLMNVQP
ncbi:hypothetical protein PMG11_01346 [Penicillium brasilianum]|uniref:Uncharacterized protein n=1 Tax=Penicillium brasilianum TaxID=104259 RepID=A0A0F7TE92_PENBI|nr:hypothetical protein PMG11_01346 [Penicillium brasilianum]